MQAKELQFHDSARARMQAGVNLLADAVRRTLGPKGRFVVLERGSRSPVIANSGVTVAKEIELRDKFENMGAAMTREVAKKTSETAGDGTTTATVLAQAIVNEGLKYVAAGMDPMELKRGLDKGVTAVTDHLKKIAKPCASSSEIAHIGCVSANGDRVIGELIAQAMEIVGKDGAISIEEGKGLKDELEVVEGMQFDRGYLSGYFINVVDKQAVELEDPLILVHDKKISAVADLLPVLEHAVNAGRPLLVIAEDVDGEALATLVVNNMRGTLRVCAVRAPGFGARRKALLEDIAVVVGATLISGDAGLKLDETKLSHLGRAKRVELTKDNTTIVSGAGDPHKVAARISEIRRQIEDTKSDYDREKLQERAAKLAGGVALLKIGAHSEVELKEKKGRVEDALHATRAAVEEGIVPGGGVALLRSRCALDALKFDSLEQNSGAKILATALEAPLRQIVANGGLDSAVIVNKVAQGSGNFGYNAATDQYGDLIEMGVLDPVKVTRCALQNAASIAGLILTTECMVAQAAER